MERRARRGRPSLHDTSREKTVESSPAQSGRGRLATKTMPTQSVPPPEAVQEEVVLNARGMPARQRKKNRYYYDEEIMITPDALYKSKTYTKRIKPEPVDTEGEEEEEEDTFTKTQYPTQATQYDSSTADEEEPVTPVPIQIPVPTPRGRGRPRRSETVDDSGKSPSPDRGKKSSIKPPTKGVRGRKKQKDKEADEETPERRKKLKEIPKPPVVIEIPKKPKMQFIRIKREPDMSLSSPRVVTSRERMIEINRELSYQEKDRQATERERREQEAAKTYPRIDERTIKQDYESPLAHPVGGRDYYLFDSSYAGGITARAGFAKTEPKDKVGELDKKTAHEISIRLRNLLKLPKAHKWVCYEWFYSNIDKVLFEGENDFQICLKESFPQLKVRKMTRVEWCKVRRLMGKPRRCSQAFFDEEREELSRRRHKIRMIQQRKVTDFNYKELPDEIPLQLVIGTKVTSRLRKPQDGLFTGTIDGVDTSNNTYRITFDRTGLGTHSIPDYEVLSNEPPETVSTSSFAMKIPRRNYGVFTSGTFKFQNPLLMGEEIPGFPKSPFPVDGMLGGFPIRLLDMIVRLSKLLKGKREKILHLKELNVEAEKLRSYGKNFNDDYRIRYARVVVDLESMNKEMNMYLEGIQQYCLEIAPDHGANQMIIPEHVQESCRQEAVLIVDTYNASKNRNMVQGNKSLTLIAEMTSLLLQVKALSSGDRNLYELKSIKDSLADIKASLGGKNVQLFQDRVEIPMNRVQTGLTLSSHK